MKASSRHATGSHRRSAPRRAIGVAVGSVGALLSLSASPSISLASSLVPAHTGLTPFGTSLEAICAGVNAGAVSRVVGYTVPAATVFPLSIKKNKEGISATGVDCTYGSDNTMAAIKRDVDLVYETTNRHVPLSEVQKVLNTMGSSPLKWTVSPYGGLSEPALLSKVSSQSFSGEEIAAEDGTKLAGAFVSSSLPTPKLADLTKLAISNYF